MKFAVTIEKCHLFRPYPSPLDRESTAWQHKNSLQAVDIVRELMSDAAGMVPDPGIMAVVTPWDPPRPAFGDRRATLYGHRTW